jgi:RNA polymerase-binding protein DksA
MTDQNLINTLEKLRKSILERRERLAKHTQHREEPIPQDFAEQATELENDETMVALERELNIELTHVEFALKRIAEGTYTMCKKCGKTINSKRLEALPSTSLCIKCASA